MIYLAVLITGLTFSILKGTGKRFFYSYLFLLFILAAFRYGVGPDYFGYEYLYLLVNTSPADQIDALSGQELLFRLLGATLNYFNFSYQQYLAVTAIITLYYVGKTCKRYSRYPVYSLYLYYCLFYFVWVFSGIRQGLTLAIGVYYLLECSESRSHTKFIIIVFLLSLIHASSLFLLVFYTIITWNPDRKILLAGVFICFIASLIPSSFLMGFFRHLPYSDRIEFYYRPEISGSEISYFDFKSISRLILLILFGVLFAKKRDFRKDIEEKILNAYIFSFGVYYALRFVEVLAANSSMYGFMLVILVIPNSYEHFKSGRHSTLFLCLALALSVAFFFKTLFSMEELSRMDRTSLLPPYTNIFEEANHFKNDTRRQVQ